MSRVFDVPVFIGGPLDGEPVPDWREATVFVADTEDRRSGGLYYRACKRAAPGATFAVRWHYWIADDQQESFARAWDWVVGRLAELEGDVGPRTDLREAARRGVA